MERSRLLQILGAVLILGHVPTLAFIFEPDPCPSAGCRCAAFSIKCDNEALQEVPIFTASAVRYTILDLSNNNISELQSGAFANITTTMLDLSHNPLVNVSDDAFQGLENDLETLELEDCGLSTVPTAVAALSRLTSLNLRHNRLITFLPGDVMAATRATLETLDFSNTGIRTWPLALRSSVRLRKLLSSGNHLTEIPDDAFLSFSNTLDYLDLSFNAMRSFPDAVNVLRVVTHMDLSFNLFMDVPAGKFINSQHSLRTLYLVHVGLRQIPYGFKDLAALENLYLSYNPIASAPNDVFHGRVAHSLKVLHMDKTLLRSVPNAVTYLTALKELNVTWNLIQYLDNYAVSLQHLETLYLDKNPITNVKSAAFAGLPALKKLYMRNTSLAFIPNSALARAPSLTFVDLSFNHFQALYDYGFPGMSHLQELVLAGNPLVNISSNAFLDLTGVAVLNLENCLLTGIPRTVQQMHALKTLKLAGNDIECSCANLGWVEGWRQDQGLIAAVEGQCSRNDTSPIQDFLLNQGRSCP